MRYDATTATRFWAKVHIPEDNELEACWPYTGGWFAGREYGVFRHQGKNLRSHRVAYELFHGELAEKEQVLHSCDNPWCCNPLHLHAGTNEENHRECKARGRRPVGVRHHRALFTEDDIRNIRKLHAGGKTPWQLAKELGCSEGAIAGIVFRRTWKHVE